MNNALIIDIIQLFERRFGSKPYVIPGVSIEGEKNNFRLNGAVGNGIVDTTGGSTRAEKEFTAKGSLLKERYTGVEVLLPIRLYDGPNLLSYLPWSVLRISGQKSIIETDLSERIGSAKEQYNIKDYVIDIKGFLIDKETRSFPENEIDEFKNLYEKPRAVTLDNALTNIWLSFPLLPPDEQRRVVVYDFDMPEQQGGREHIRPFTMKLKSDTVFTLELE